MSHDARSTHADNPTFLVQLCYERGNLCERQQHLGPLECVLHMLPVRTPAAAALLKKACDLSLLSCSDTVFFLES